MLQNMNPFPSYFLLLILPVIAFPQTTLPESFAGVSQKEGVLILESGKWSETPKKPHQWGYALEEQEIANVEVEADIRILEHAKRFGFFGQSWSVWPDLTYGDEGFEAGIVLRLRETEETPGFSGYRVQLSHKYQEISLVKFPEGGYVKSVPCEVSLERSHRVKVITNGAKIIVSIDGIKKIQFNDHILPILSPGKVGFGTSSQAKVKYSNISVKKLENNSQIFNPDFLTTHEPDFRHRIWLGERPWIFDGDEPIMLLPVPKARYINNVKLRPGYKPLLSWNSHWGVENQGAYKVAENTNSEIKVSGGGKSIKFQWKGEHVNKRFITATSMHVKWDKFNHAYVYEIDSTMEVQKGEPFDFRYGFDFEHHTPLDPFRWKYLMIKKKDGVMSYRPLSPFDPGPLQDLAIQNGARVWYGRTGGAMEVCPAVIYNINPKWHKILDQRGNTITRKLNTAVCAAFYDTGVSFPREIAKPGTKIRVNYSYTGIPAKDAEKLLKDSIVQDNPRIDPEHQFIFARKQWPKITFGDATPMDQPWWGGRPYLTGHNARPSYDRVKLQNNSTAIRLGPVSYGVAPIGPVPIETGKYLIKAKVKSTNTHGPGGRIEILSLKKGNKHGNGYIRSNKANILKEEVRFLGQGTTDWKTVQFVTEIPKEAEGIALGLGNAGTGEVLISEITFEKIQSNSGIEESLSNTPSSITPTIEGALWEFRMEEQSGFHVYNFGNEERYRTLELANIDWVKDEGRNAIRFKENHKDRADYPKLGILDRYLKSPQYGNQYEKFSHGAYAITGYHGGGRKYTELTLAAWIKPEAEMGKSHHKGKGDIIGFGARKFILGLHGQEAPYKLAARLNVNDRFESEPIIPANKWSHVAMTAKASNKFWKVKLFVNGESVAEGISQKFTSDTVIPPSLILGAELFYLHDAYYRGLIGHTIILERSLSQNEVKILAR